MANLVQRIAADANGPAAIPRRNGVRWFVLGTTVSIPPFAVMFALLRGLLPAPHREIFLIGGVTFVVGDRVALAQIFAFEVSESSWNAG